MNDIYLIAPAEKSFDEDMVSFEKAGSSYVEKVNENKVNALYIRRIQENIGLGSISAFLETKNISVKIMNASIDEITNDKIVETILNDNPLIVGISILYDLHVYNALDIIIKLRKEGYQNHITLGGTHVSLAYERYMETFEYIDSIIIGDGEESFYELYMHLRAKESVEDISGLAYRKDGQIKYNKKCYPPDKISYPKPKRDTLAYLQERGITFTTAAVYASRGCNNNCIYCGAPPMRKCHNKIWRPRQEELLVDEIQYLIDTFGVSFLYFCDDNFCGYGESGRDHIMDFVRLMKQKNLSIKFHAEIRADTKLTEEDFKQLKEVGLDEVLIGIESGSQKCLNRWRKGAKVEDNEKMIRLLKRCNIDIAPAFIMVDPYTSLDELKESYTFIMNNELYKSKEPWSLFNKMIIYPGSILEEVVYKDGVCIPYQPERYSIPEHNADNLNSVCKKISSIPYEIQDGEIRVLWKVLIKFVDRISDLVDNVIPGWLGQYTSRDNIRIVSRIGKWRRNLGLLLMELLRCSIECVEASDIRELEDALYSKLEETCDVYDEKYLGNRIENYIKIHQKKGAD